jgi:Type II restriction endonuclease EcoO109I
MQNLSYQELLDYIGDNIIQPFYQLRLTRLNELSLRPLLRRKNPYLFKAKNITTAQDFVTELIQAHLSSQEETIFGGYLEQLAIFVCSKVYSGFKSSAGGIDLEFQKDTVRYIVAIKSGPNWGNSMQIAKMRLDFQKAKRILGTNTSRTNIVAVNGCCYGKDNKPDKGDYLKLCGQEFWTFISEDDELYVKIIEPLDEEAKQKDEEFKKAYSKKINLLTSEFLQEFCDMGDIDWVKLLRFVSSKS